MGLSVYAQTVYSSTSALKTKTTKISGLYPGATVRIIYYDDLNNRDILVYNEISPTTITYGSTTPLVVNLPSNNGKITVSFNGGTATVKLENVNCYKKTPYVEVFSGKRDGYKADNWTTISDDGDAGMSNSITPNPPLPNAWEDDFCRFYLGANFTATEKTVVWTPVSTTVQYHKNDGGTSTASQTFTYGVAKQQFGKKTDGSYVWEPFYR